MGFAPSCPICKKDVLPRAKNTAFPFCSTRCQMVDLGKWLSDEYRVPTDEPPDGADGDSNDAPCGPARRREDASDMGDQDGVGAGRSSDREGED